MTELERLALVYQKKTKSMKRFGDVLAGVKGDKLDREYWHSLYIKSFDAWQKAQKDLLEYALNYTPVVEVAAQELTPANLRRE
jgi:hypothetical protein